MADKDTKELALSVQGYLGKDTVKKYLQDMLKERAGQFMTSLISLSNLTPGLEKCEPKSLMMCGLKAMSLNLPLDNNLGFAYAISYNNSKKGLTEAQFQIGYKGFVQLALRTGQYRFINVLAVKKGELKKWDALTETLEIEMIDDAGKRDKTETIGYAAMFELLNGFRKTIYWPKDKMQTHAKRFSKMYDRTANKWRSGSVWHTDEEVMSFKTILKALLSKWGALSTEMEIASKYDQTVTRVDETTGVEEIDYIDSTKDEAQAIAYEIPTDLLDDINKLCDIVGVSEADKTMRLGACSGDVEKVKEYIKELEGKVKYE